MSVLTHSIRNRLLAVVVGTVLAVVVVHDLVAVREVRRMALGAATERLTTVSSQLGDMFQAQAAQMRTMATARANNRLVRAVLDGSATPADRDSAAAALRRDIAVNLVGFSLWGADGRSLLSVGTTAEQDSAVASELRGPPAGRDSTTISRFANVRDTLVYGVMRRVGAERRLLGTVVEWRRFARSPEGRKQLRDIIGSSADVLVGNTRGNGWTDLADLVPRPAVEMADTGRAALASYERAGTGPVLAAVRPITGTPWTLVVDFPQAKVVAPVRAALGRLAASTLALVLVGVLVAWWFAARLTTPLRDLAGAAEGLTAGDYSRRVRVAGNDEVATLGTAFNTMAESIDTAHRALEEHSAELADRAEQLGEQAAELEATNEQLAQSVEDATRMRDELATVSAELDACLASAPVGFALYDDDGRYRRVNASLAQMHGLDAAALLGRAPSDVERELGPRVEQHAREVLAGGVPVVNAELSTTGPDRDGANSRHWLVSVFPIRAADGESLGVGSVVTDLSEYKKLERQLLQAQKMEAVGRLAGGVAHDFNNILTAISGFGQFALSDLADAAIEGPRADIEQVLAAAARGGALTRQLLAFSRQQVLQPRVLDLNAVVTSVGPMLARLIGTDVHVRTMSSLNLGPVKADPNQMEQVIVNLVVNARDAMPNGGTITIETADVELDATYAETHPGVVPGRYVLLAVTDNGSGMDAVTRARVFDPFFTTKGPGKGTGLGLATVYGIVKQSGGNVEVYSEPGQGSSFKVYLPCSAEPAPADVERREPVVATGLATILLVDDDDQVSATARRALERGGYTVIAAPGGSEALRLAAEDRAIDLLVTDLVMPGMGGRELARRILETRPDIRILFMSGYTAQAMNQQAILDSSDAFLGKPFTPDALLARVAQLLQAPRRGA